MKKLSKVKIVGFVLLIVLIAIGVFVGAKILLKQRSLVLVKQVLISTEDKKIYEDRIQKRLEGIKTIALGDNLERGNYYLSIANDQMSLGLLGEAEKSIKEAIKLSPGNPAFLQAYATILDQMNNSEDALGVIDKALTIRPQVLDYWNLKVTIMQHLDMDIKEIKSVYQEAIQKVDPTINAITAYARYLESIGDTQGAIDQWNAAITKNVDGKSMYQPEITRLTSILTPQSPRTN